jgi:hypothetical protein
MAKHYVVADDSEDGFKFYLIHILYSLF